MTGYKYQYTSNSGFKTDFISAWIDIRQAIINKSTWVILGLSELQHRYRRSAIGPFWVTLSMGIQTLVTGVLLAYLFNQEVNRFLPFISISLILWTLFSSVLNEGAVCFTGMSGIILQVNRPLFSYLLLIVWRNILVFLHTIFIFLIAAFYFKIYPTSSYLLIPLGLFLFIVNISWMALLCGIISARFRDMPPIIQNILNVLVWLTPIYYSTTQVGNTTKMIISFNPVTYIFEVARGPFLNSPPSFNVWLIAFFVALIGWILTLTIYANFRNRIPYWL
jgi:lipopolysaccharide transport system permease protein